MGATVVLSCRHACYSDGPGILGEVPHVNDIDEGHSEGAVLLREAGSVVLQIELDWFVFDFTDRSRVAVVLEDLEDLGPRTGFQRDRVPPHIGPTNARVQVERLTPRV